MVGIHQILLAHPKGITTTRFSSVGSNREKSPWRALPYLRYDKGDLFMGAGTNRDNSKNPPRKYNRNKWILFLKRISYMFFKTHACSTVTGPDSTCQSAQKAHHTTKTLQ